MTLFVIHGLILVITFHKIPVPPFWAPLIRVTTFRMKVARGCLVLTVANFIVDLPLLVTSSSAERGLEQLLVLFVTALLLISAVYIVKHWALRPENIISAFRIRTTVVQGLSFDVGKGRRTFERALT